LVASPESPLGPVGPVGPVLPKGPVAPAYLVILMGGSIIVTKPGGAAHVTLQLAAEILLFIVTSLEEDII
jgi:hypothetical protein